MALNLIKHIQSFTKTNVLPTISALNPVFDTRRQLSSNKPLVPHEEPKDLQEFEKNLERHMQEYVLDRKTHTGQVGPYCHLIFAQLINNSNAFI